MRPLRPPVEEREPYTLDLADVTGKRIVETRLSRTVTVREEHAAAALEVMSRFAVDPRWLAYLPPTMAPAPATRRDGLLEHPAEAFDQYRRDGVTPHPWHIAVADRLARRSGRRGRSRSTSMTPKARPPPPRGGRS